MHSPDPKGNRHVKSLSIKDKKSLQAHIFKGIISATGTPSKTSTTNGSNHVSNNSRISNRTNISHLTLGSNTSLDFQIKYETKYHKLPGDVSLSVPRSISPRTSTVGSTRPPSSGRNPILQTGLGATDNGQKASGVKIVREPKATSLCPEESKTSSKARAEFSYRREETMNKDTPKKEGKKIIRHESSRSFADEERRMRKAVPNRSTERTNPILQGDPTYQPPKPRIVEQQISPDTKRLHDNKFLNKFEREEPPRPRFPQKESQLKQLLTNISSPRTTMNNVVAANASLGVKKNLSILKDLLDHSHNSDAKFKTSLKCTEMPYNLMKENVTTTNRYYAKRKVDIQA